MKKQVIVTTSWDDGHKLDLKLAKLLKKYGIKGTFYIAPSNREWDEKDLLSNSEIKHLSQDFEIGAHTLTHPAMTKINYDEAEQEVLESKEYLEKLTGKRIVSFCYPRGKHNPAIQEMIQQAGFTSARTVERHSFTFPDNRFVCDTTIHTYKHYSDIFKIARFSRWNPLVFMENMNWECLAKRMFDRVMEKGGLYHLWGHSWEIDKNKDWNRLKNVFLYIGGRSGVRYLENKEVIEVAI